MQRTTPVHSTVMPQVCLGTISKSSLLPLSTYRTVFPLCNVSLHLCLPPSHSAHYVTARHDASKIVALDPSCKRPHPSIFVDLDPHPVKTWKSTGWSYTLGVPTPDLSGLHRTPTP
eukprot:764404-Hanusia_phi.AAC.1